MTGIDSMVFAPAGSVQRLDEDGLRERACQGIPELQRLMDARFAGLTHEEAVEAIMRLGFRKRGFSAELRKNLADGTDNTRRPDAFLISAHTPVGSGPSEGSIIVVEVDHSHPTPWEKWNSAAYDADADAMWLFVVIVDRSGVPYLRWSCGDLLTAPTVVTATGSPILDEWCPSCGAAPGASCRTRNNTRAVRPHRARECVARLESGS